MQSFREENNILLLLLKQILICLAETMAILLLLYIARRHGSGIYSKTFKESKEARQ